VPYQRLVPNAKTAGSNSDDAGDGDEYLRAGGPEQGYAEGGTVKGGQRSRAGGVEEIGSQGPSVRHLSGGDGSGHRGFQQLFPDVDRRFDGRQVDSLTPEGPDGFEEDPHTVASVMAALPPSIPPEELVGGNPSTSPTG
jgi:hypothetical protein